MLNDRSERNLEERIRKFEEKIKGIGHPLTERRLSVLFGYLCVAIFVGIIISIAILMLSPTINLPDSGSDRNIYKNMLLTGLVLGLIGVVYVLVSPDEQNYLRNGQKTDKIKIFEGGTVKEELAKLLKEGYKPATVEQIKDLMKGKKIRNLWYNTGTICINGTQRTATLKELKNIEKEFKKGMRLVFVGGYYSGGLVGDFDLDYVGRFVGVKK